MTELLSPQNGETVILHTRMQSDFRKQQHHTAYKGTINWEHPERSGNEESTRPAKNTFIWKTDDEISCFELREADNPENVITLNLGNSCVTLDNLKVGTKYIWRVNSSEEFTFTTDPTPPRFIRADGVSNVRDIGGWMTKHGRRMKQGIIYRCGKPDSMDGDCGVSAFGELGIRCEIDLRREMLGQRTTAMIGENVKYLNLPCDGYEPFIIQKSECKALMEALADEANLPLIFHCVGGADRTGTLAFMLEALCGVDENDLFLDYELTTLSIWGERSRNAEYFGTLITALRAYGDENTPWDILAERFMTDCGISPDTVARIREILLE